MPYDFCCFTFVSGVKSDKTFSIGNLRIISKNDLHLYVQPQHLNPGKGTPLFGFFQKAFDKKICLLFKTKAADHDFAEEALNIEIDGFVNYLRFLFGLRNNLYQIAKDDKHFEIEGNILFSKNGVSTRFGGTVNHYVLNITDDFIHLKERNNDVIISFYEKKNKTQLDNDIFNGIKWIGLSIYEQVDDIALTEIALAFEAVLKYDDGTMITKSIQGQIAENVAFLCGETLEERLRIKELFKNLYSFRSAVVHRSKKQVVEPYDVYFSLFKDTIVNILKKYPHCKTIKKLSEEIEKYKYRT